MRIPWLEIGIVAGIVFASCQARADTERVAVSESRAVGVQAEAAGMVTRQVYATVARLGYGAVAESETSNAARFSPGGPTSAELLALADATGAAHALMATVSSHDALYVVTLTLANANRTGPYTRTSEAPAASLEATVDAMTRALLGTPQQRAATVTPTPVSTPAPEPRKESAKARLAIQTEGAVGIATHRFYNHLAGARLDYVFATDFALGAYAGYLNAKGKEGRVSNALAYLQFEYRLAPVHGSGFRIPLRVGSGYVPRNGPFLRLAAGVGFPLGDSARLTFDLLTPTVWIVKDSTVFSMDVAAEVSFDL
jgi:hypothetical protein